MRGGALRELLDHPRADALALEVVGDRERGLGQVGVAKAHVVADRDDPLVVGVAHDPDERPASGKVRLDEGSREPVVRVGEPVEAQEAASHGEPGEERHDRRNVGLAGRAQPHGAAVAQDHIGGHEGEFGHLD